MGKIKRICLVYTLLTYVMSTLWTSAYAGKVILTEKEVIPPNGRKVRVQQRETYSLTEEIKDVLGARPDVPLNVYQALYQRGLMAELESGSIELKDAWGMIKSGLLFDVESLVERDDLEGFLSDPHASLKADQDIQQSYFSKLLKHLENIETFERALRSPQQALSVALKEAKEWVVQKAVQLKEFYQEYLTQGIGFIKEVIKYSESTTVRYKLTEHLFEKAIMTGDILMGSEERFYRVSRRVARTVVSVNERGEPIKKEQGSSVSNHAVSSLPKDNPRLYFKAFSSRVGLKPGNEFMMGSLYDLLNIPYPETGVLLFTNLTHNNNPPSIVMVSEGIPGRTGKQVLKENPEFFESLDQEAYEKQVLGAMLTDHGDGKADNFICLENPPRLVPIDNEEVFVPILSEDKKGLRIKSILFTLPQMETPLSSYQRSYLQSLTPQWISYMWVTEMERRNQAYHQLEQSLSFQMLKQQYQTVNMGAYRASPQDTIFKHYHHIQSTLTANHPFETHCYLFPETFCIENGKPSPLLSILSLPLTITEGRLKDTIDRLGIMQLVLRDHKRASLQNLLGGIHPLIGAYYQKLRDEKRDTNTQKINIKEALRFLYGLNDAHQQNAIETFLGRNTSIQGPDGGLTVAERVKRLQGLQVETGENPAVLQGSLRQSIQFNELLLKALTFLREGYFPIHSYIRDLEQFREEGLRDLIEGEKESNLLRDLWINGQRVLSHISENLLSEREDTSIHRVWNEAFHSLRPLRPSLDWLMTVEENFLPRELAKDKNTSFLIEGGWMGKRILPSTIKDEIIDKQGQLKKDESLSGRSVVRGYPKEKPLFYFKAYPEFPGYEYGATSFMRRLGIQGLPLTDLLIFRPGDDTTGSSQQASSSTPSISAATKSSQPTQSPYPVLLTQAIKGNILKKHWDKPLTNLDFEHTSRLIIASMLINPEDGKEDNFILSPDGRYLIPIDNDHVFLPGATRTVEGWLVKKVNTTLQGKTVLYCLDEMKKPLLPETVEFIKSINVDLFLKGWLEDLTTANEKYQNLERTEENLLTQFLKKETVLRIPLDPEFMNNLYWKFHQLQDILTYQPDLPLIEILKRIEPYMGKRYEEVLASPRHRTLESRFKQVTRNLYPTDARGNHISVLNSRAMMEIMHVPESEVTGRAHNIKQGPTAALTQLDRLRTESQKQEWKAYLEHGREPKAIDGRKAREEQAYIDSLMKSTTLPEILAVHFSKRFSRDQLTSLLEHEKGKKLKLIDLRGSERINTREIQAIATLAPNLEVLNVSGCKSLEGVQGAQAGERLQFPALRRLIIDKCPQLTALFIEAPLLQLIEASENKKLTQFSMNTPKLELQLMRGNITAAILRDIARYIPNLEVLNMSECRNLEGIQGAQAGERVQFPALRRLLINSCPQLTTLFIEAPHLQLIEASENQKLTQFSMNTPLLELQLMRGNITPVILRDIARYIPNLEVLNMSECRRLEGVQGAQAGERLQFPALRRLIIERCPQLATLCIEAPLLQLIEASENIELKRFSMNTPELKDFELTWKSLRGESLEDLSTILPQTKITKLGKSWQGKILALYTSQRDKINELSLMNQEIGPVGTKALAAVLPQTKIERLDLENNNIGEEGVRSLATVLPQTKIERLDLANNNIGEEGVRSLAAVLPQTQIIGLYLANNNIGEEGVRSLAAVLPQTQIIGLYLANNNIGEEGIRSLAAVLPQTQIRWLNLKHNNIGEEGVRSLATVLPQTQIIGLNLDGNNIRTEGIKSLVTVLPQTQIISLDLCNNNIGEEGVRSLAAVLPQTKIKELYLSNNNIGEEGIKALAAVLPQTKITTLYLWSNDVGDGGVKFLAAVLPQTQITWLRLNYNEIGTEGAKALAAVLPQTQITGLNLENNNIGEEGVRSLAAVLPQTKIIGLSLLSNNISTEGKALLEALKEKMKINIFY